MYGHAHLFSLLHRGEKPFKGFTVTVKPVHILPQTLFLHIVLTVAAAASTHIPPCFHLAGGCRSPLWLNSRCGQQSFRCETARFMIMNWSLESFICPHTLRHTLGQVSCSFTSCLHPVHIVWLMSWPGSKVRKGYESAQDEMSNTTLTHREH